MRKGLLRPGWKSRPMWRRVSLIILAVLLVILAVELTVLWHYAGPDFGLHSNITVLWFPVGRGEGLIPQITIDSFDPDKRLIEGSITIPGTDECSRFFKEAFPQARDIKCLVPQVRDRVHLFEADGFEDILELPETEIMLLSNEEPASNSEISRFRVSVDGNPVRYPFDRYLLVVQPLYGATASVDDSNRRRALEIVAHGGSATFSVPGYEATTPDVDQLRRWMWEDVRRSARDPQDHWLQRHIYIELERPLFLKVLAVLLGASALVSIVGVTLASKREDLPKLLVGSLLSLWALRGILSSGAPRGTTLIDYATLLLLLLQCGLVFYVYVRDSRHRSSRTKHLGKRSLWARYRTASKQY